MCTQMEINKNPSTCLPPSILDHIYYAEINDSVNSITSLIILHFVFMYMHDRKH